MKKIDELFEQVFNESGLPDRTTPADSFIEPGTDILDFDKERNERIKKEVVKRLKQEAFPDNWMVGRKGNNHTATKTAPRTYDDEDANFIVRNSGQPDLEKDLEEHHEDYPDDILQMSVGDFLTKSKEKDEELYHGFEDVIDKYIGGESVTEGWKDWFKKGKKPKVDHGSFKQQALKALENALKDNDIYPEEIEEWLLTKVTHRYGGYDTFGKDKSPERISDKDIRTATNIISKWERYSSSNDTKGVESTKKELYNHLKRTLIESKINEVNMLHKFDIANDNLRDVGSYLWDRKHKDAKKFETLFSALEKLISRRELANMSESKLTESAMGDVYLMATEAPTFKKFIQDIFKEFRDLDKTKESIAWLKSIYDNK